MDATGALDDNKSCPWYMRSEVLKQLGVLVSMHVDSDIDSR